jgi:hypothetical protein
MKDEQQHPHLGSLSGAGYHDHDAAVFWRWLLGIAAGLLLVGFAAVKLFGG